MAKVYAIGTMDTKGAELRFVAEHVLAAGAEPVLVDVGTQGVASHQPDGQKAVLGLADRGNAVSAMARALTLFPTSRRDIGAVLGLGGSGITALVTGAMRSSASTAPSSSGCNAGALLWRMSAPRQWQEPRARNVIWLAATRRGLSR